MAGESYQSNWEAWMPDPIDADPSKTSKSRRSNDILSMLVQIYGSKELFVTEYRFILAEKLLKKVDYDTDKEVSLPLYYSSILQSTLDGSTF